MEYRIYVGTGDVDGVARLVAAWLQGATVQSATGIWQGKTEASTVITVIGDTDTRRLVHSLAERLRYAFDQDSVLITESAVIVTEVTQ